MLTSDLDYHLPPELIAQTPARPRESARLLRLRRDSGATSHHTIADLPDLLRPDDLLIFNDSRVLRARLQGVRSSGGRVEALLLREREVNEWDAMLKPSARLKVGERVEFASHDGGTRVYAVLQGRESETWRVRFEGSGDVRDLLPRVGEVPLPPYIAPPTHDIEADYQTVYARASVQPGAALDSAAAPTAGLHFSPELLAALQGRGIRFAFVTLGVGAGTFRPVQTEVLAQHEMHSEAFEIPARTVELVAEQKARGGRVVAVGTTSARALEGAAQENDGALRAGRGETRLFIRPGYAFRVPDAMLTNFHLPRSTLLAMIAAFCEQKSPDNARNPQTVAREMIRLESGVSRVRAAYEEAVRERYRFFSWGDAMLID